MRGNISEFKKFRSTTVAGGLITKMQQFPLYNTGIIASSRNPRPGYETWRRVDEYGQWLLPSCWSMSQLCACFTVEAPWNLPKCYTSYSLLTILTLTDKYKRFPFSLRLLATLFSLSNIGSAVLPLLCVIRPSDSTGLTQSCTKYFSDVHLGNKSVQPLKTTGSGVLRYFPKLRTSFYSHNNCKVNVKG